MIKAHWCLSTNFGDCLTKYILEKYKGDKVAFVDGKHSDKFTVAVGSILNWDMPNADVWGAGIANVNDYIPEKNVITTRGWYSFARAERQATHNKANNGFSNLFPEYVGDIGMLMPIFYQPKTTIKHKIGLVPHYIDYYIALEKYPQYHVIDVLKPVEEVITEICSCSFIASSSLHGLIIADAYGVPSRWVTMSDLIGGDGIKYIDYFTTVKGMEYTNAFIMDRELKSTDFNTSVEPDIDLNKVLDLCP